MREKTDQAKAFYLTNGSYWITETLKGLCSTKCMEFCKEACDADYGNKKM